MRKSILSNKIYAAIDNGVSGSIAVIHPDGTVFYEATPVVRCLNYTKTKAWINRLDYAKFKAILEEQLVKPELPMILLLERPMIMPARFKATVSAIRCDEAQRGMLDLLKIPFVYFDSKQWQRDGKNTKGMLPSGMEGDELKVASKQIGQQLFPKCKIKKDADALLMAEFARRHNL